MIWIDRGAAVIIIGNVGALVMVHGLNCRETRDVLVKKSNNIVVKSFLSHITGKTVHVVGNVAVGMMIQ